jgi:hypothetical protein
MDEIVYLGARSSQYCLPVLEDFRKSKLSQMSEEAGARMLGAGQESP